VKDRVCDTVYDIDINPRDDFQCTNIDSELCYETESVIKDVKCTYTFEFECHEEKRRDGGYGKEKVCRKKPVERCYDIPRTIRSEECKPHVYKWCEKFTNPFPHPVERQNCHFEPKKICEIETKNRPKKAKNFHYHKNCQKVPREVCDQSERKTVEPLCDQEERQKCEYVPEKKCSEEQKKYCYKVEKIIKEEVCDKKWSRTGRAGQSYCGLGECWNAAEGKCGEC